MKLHSLPRLVTRSSKRLGRGYGSGRGGHTVGRGQKGQKTRGSIPAHFVGTSWVWFKRLPLLRGKSRFKPLARTLTLTLSDLNALPPGSKVDLPFLYHSGLIKKTALNRVRVKIVARGVLSQALTVSLPVTPAAAQAITKAGGTILDQTA